MRYILWMQIPVHSDLVYLLAGGFRFPFTLHPYFLFHSCPPFPLPYMPHTHTHIYINAAFSCTHVGESLFSFAVVWFFIHSYRIFIHANSVQKIYEMKRKDSYKNTQHKHYFLFNLIFLTSSVNINLPMYIFSLKDWWKYQFSICQKFEHFALYWAKIFELPCNSSSYLHLPYLWGWIKRKLNTLNWTEYLLLLCFLACMCYLAPPAHSLRSTPPVGWSLFRRKSLLLGALFCSPPFFIYFYCVARLKCALQIFYACQLPSEEVEISPFSGVGGWVGANMFIWHTSQSASFAPHANLSLCRLPLLFAYRIKVFCVWIIQRYTHTLAFCHAPFCIWRRRQNAHHFPPHDGKFSFNLTKQF